MKKMHKYWNQILSISDMDKLMPMIETAVENGEV